MDFRYDEIKSKTDKRKQERKERTLDPLKPQSTMTDELYGRQCSQTKDQLRNTVFITDALCPTKFTAEETQEVIVQPWSFLLVSMFLQSAGKLIFSFSPSLSLLLPLFS